ncbi:SRPBCC domain-containing protein [Lysobacter silvisoli]|uniref:SRPBCC domain-containing protein n=1 Tax=Lysobacter silvisoli TaxID=2293254 RepID=A0A371K1M9_9GAMM|nr:SRPBCC domain-containing protein [Lysobacter silvisoli]RDZ27752.1 SRPBCC domain-containing protein [Lysobacter silvisoli]
MNAPAPRARRSPIQWLWPLVAGVAVGLGLRWVFSAKAGEAYATMLVSFVLLAPLVVGMVAAYVAQRRGPQHWAMHFGLGVLANVFFIIGTMVMGWEGAICAILASPIFTLIGGAGGLLMSAIFRFTARPKPPLYGFLALPLVLGALENPQPQGRIEQVERTVAVAATPQAVWQQLMRADAIRPDEVDAAWSYRIGVPKPLSGLVHEDARGLVREVRMGKGIHFRQLSTDWQPQRYVRWQYAFDEDSVPPGALDDHVRIGGEYFDLRDTTYTLIPREGGTELKVSMSYRVSTGFDWYAAPLARWLLGNQCQVLLDFYRHRAEAAPPV